MTFIFSIIKFLSFNFCKTIFLNFSLEITLSSFSIPRPDSCAGTGVSETQELVARGKYFNEISPSLLFQGFLNPYLLIFPLHFFSFHFPPVVSVFFPATLILADCV